LSAITDSARDQICELRIPFVCNHDRATTVWCHRNGVEFKGIGAKSPDLLGSYGCSACHDAYDRRVPLSAHAKSMGITREEVELCFSAGHARSLLRLLESGIIRLSGRTP
jgi:Protein of unknown function (DUF1364)